MYGRYFDIIEYNTHKWFICGDLTVVTSHLALQTEYIKYYYLSETAALENNFTFKNHYFQELPTYIPE